MLLIGARPMVVYLAREGKVAACRSGMRGLAPSSFHGGESSRSMRRTVGSLILGTRRWGRGRRSEAYAQPLNALMQITSPRQSSRRRTTAPGVSISSDCGISTPIGAGNSRMLASTHAPSNF